MLKNFLIKIIQFTILPLRKNKRIFFKVKEILFASSSEHLFRFLLHVNTSEPGIIIDVGAANGETAVFFAKYLKHAKIYAYEPNPKMWPIIEQNIKDYKSIKLKRIALSESKGQQTLHVTANNWSSSLKQLNATEIKELPVELKNYLYESESVEVDVSTLDEEFFNAENILAIKLDTQGNELNVLKGGEEVLKKTRFIITELNNHNIYSECDQYFQVDEFLRYHNFRLLDMVVSYRTNHKVLEYDAIYENIDLC